MPSRAGGGFPVRGGTAPGGAFLLLDIAFEAVKEILPYAGLGDEDVAAVRLVADPAQIAERAKGVQGARDHRLRDAEDVGEPAHRMRAGREVYQKQQRHLAIRKVGL